MTRLLVALASASILTTAPGASAAGPTVTGSGARPSPIERAHAQALELFRRARFSEAYGRFIQLADAGHPASARYAIWMCENGTALFGAAWDCAPHELEEWRAVATGPLRSGSPGSRHPPR